MGRKNKALIRRITGVTVFFFLGLTPCPSVGSQRDLPVDFSSPPVREKSFEEAPDFRFASSDFTQDKNRILWQNVLTQELAHRFGSFLTSAAGNPFGMLGRALAHWGVFFDADFSPLDGNDWQENGDGTFTLKKSYLDEAAFKRSLEGMPYNDLDLYTFGLLDPNKINSPFVIANPTLEDGRKLRMHSSGNLVEIQNPDGTWSGPYYLPTGIKIKGTRKTIALKDITDLEGKRDPAFPNTQKDFKAAFLTTLNDEESSLDTLEMTQKLQRFKDSFTRFFNQMARNLGNLLFPKAESGSGSGGSGGGGGGGVFRGDHPHPFEPLDFTQLKPVGFEESLEKMLPSSYYINTLKDSLFRASFSPVNLFGNPSFSPETLDSLFKELPPLATASLTLIPSVLTDSVQLETLNSKLETPLLYSDWKESQIKSLRDLWPERNAFPDPDALQAPEIPQEKFSISSPVQVTPVPLPKPVAREEKSLPSPSSGVHSPKSFSHTPLIWGAFKTPLYWKKVKNFEKREGRYRSRVARVISESGKDRTIRIKLASISPISYSVSQLLNNLKNLLGLRSADNQEWRAIPLEEEPQKSLFPPHLKEGPRLLLLEGILEPSGMQLESSDLQLFARRRALYGYMWKEPLLKIWAETVAVKDYERFKNALLEEFSSLKKDVAIALSNLTYGQREFYLWRLRDLNHENLKRQGSVGGAYLFAGEEHRYHDSIF